MATDSTKTRAQALPALTDTSPAGIKRWAGQLQTLIARLTGESAKTSNARLDQAATFRDLIAAGIAVEAPPGTSVPVVPPGGSAPGSIVPPAVTGLTVERLPFNMRLTWDLPTYAGHSRVEVWRATSNNLTLARKVTDVWNDVSIYEDGFQAGQGVFYWVRAVSNTNQAGPFNSISGTSDNAQPGDVLGFDYTIEGFGVRLRWRRVVDADVQVYELRRGSSWDTGTPMDGGAPGTGTDVGGTDYLWRVQTTGTYRVFVRARDATGYYSGSATPMDVEIDPPTIVAPLSSFALDSAVLTWQAVTGAFAIAFYEVRQGTSWAGAVVLDRVFATSFSIKAQWLGLRRFWLAATDVAGNYGPPVAIDVVVEAPGPVSSYRSEVVDNNVLLYWQPPSTGSLPVATYELRKGATYDAALPLGDKNGSFTVVFEQAAGVYTYWIAARDVAGNVGEARPISATVNQPPDYVLFSDQDMVLENGSLVNAIYEGGQVILPFDPASTWDDHYGDRGWAGDTDAIAAGYPRYAHPTVRPGSWQLAIDYGAVITPTSATVTPFLVPVHGAVSTTVTLAYKLNMGDAWTDLGTSNFVPTNFRYLRVTVTVDAADDASFARLTTINVKLSTKLRQDAGSGHADAADVGGTLVNLNYPFIDLHGPPMVQPKGTTPLFGVVDFVDGPNPTTFKVFIFDNAGVRQSADFSWFARGV